MKKLSLLIATLGVTSILGIANNSEAQQVCNIHNDEPTLSSVLALPIPTTQIIPATWAQVGNKLISAQAHWSTASGIIQHTHFEIPAQLMYCEINGPITFPFREILYQTGGYFDLAQMANEDLQNIIWDETGTSIPPNMDGDPTLGAVVMHTGRMTIDPTRPKHWRPEFDAPPHGWFNEQFQFMTRYTDGTLSTFSFMFPMFSTIDPSFPEVNEADPRWYGATYPAKELRVINGPAGINEDFWGSHELVFQHLILPTFGTLIQPFTPPEATFDSFIYAGQQIISIFDPTNATTDFRIGVDLHHNIPGTILYQNHQLNACCGTPLPFKFDPAELGSGIVKTTLFWAFNSGPNGADFPTNRTVNTLLTMGITSNTDNSTGDTTPPVVNLSGLLDGESIVNGAQFTLSATATDASGIMQVQFFDNNVLITTDNTAPYTAPWSATIPGVHVIKAVAMDASSNMNTASAQVTVTVQNVILTWNPVIGQDYRLLDNIKTCYDDGKCTDPVTVR